MGNADRSNRTHRQADPASPIGSATLRNAAAQTNQQLHTLEADTELRRRHDAMQEEPERWDGMS